MDLVIWWGLDFCVDLWGLWETCEWGLSLFLGIALKWNGKECCGSGGEILIISVIGEGGGTTTKA